ncbi:MAG TPA: hypothetical protein PKA41_06770, partial [Verrucomicrobiota bacterium]|nr:hypothetical protein [Verrucomicrobiota bacterium]
TRSIERAAESVLGSETEALRFAQRELDDLARQVERELAGDGTNAVTSAGGDSRESRTNATARADDDSAGNESRSAADNSQDQQNREGNPSTAGQGENRGEQANAGEQGDRGDGRQQLGDGNANQSARSPGRQPGGQVQNNGNANGGGNADSLREFVQQLGQNNANRNAGRPITGNEYVNWSDRLRDVEQTLNSQDLRNELATVRERMGVMRAGFRDRGLVPDNVAIQKQILAPLSQVRVWVQEELARMEKSDSLVPLDRDPVPENYSDLVRKYYEQLGSAK